MIEIEQDVLFSAIKLYGADRQLDKLVEEIGELLQALVKWRQGGDKLHLLEELADVYIMLEQAAMILDVPAETGPTLLQAAIDKKIGTATGTDQKGHGRRWKTRRRSTSRVRIF